MPKSNTRLELTWIGKENRPKLEPRILVEEPEKSYHAKFRREINRQGAKSAKGEEPTAKTPGTPREEGKSQDLGVLKDKSTWEANLIPRSDKMRKTYKNPDNDPRGPYKADNFTTSLTGGQRGAQFARTGISENLYEIVTPSGRSVLPPKGTCWRYSRARYEELLRDNRVYFGPNGNNVPSYKRFLSEVQDGVRCQSVLLRDDVGDNQEAKREVTVFNHEHIFSTPKPERLIERILTLSTNPGDWALDSFAGSGTTGAVAHKMGRRWIMVELGEHCHTHIIPRMKKVIDGEDQGGISQAVNWKGGGGFRYYRLGPSLIVKDEWDNPVINPDFNAGMLAEAMCKLEGFTFDPNPEVYWQQGRSSETDFIYVTTQMMTKEMLTKLSDEVGPNRSLLICCGAYRADVTQFENLTVKKIPKAVLKKCEWGHDDYSLEIRNLPVRPVEEMNRQDAKDAKGRRKDDTLDALFQKRDIEVDQETKGKVHGFEIGHDLGGVDGGEGVDSLQFYDQLAVDQQVQATFSDGMAFVFHADWLLPFEWHIPQFQFDRQRLFVDTFQVPWPQNPMHLDGRANHGIRQTIDLFARFLHQSAPPWRSWRLGGSSFPVNRRTSRSKSLSNRRSWTTRNFSNSLSANSWAIAAETLPASCRMRRSSISRNRSSRSAQSAIVMGIRRLARSSARSR